MVGMAHLNIADEKVISVPLGAKYLKLQMWVTPNTNKPSSYLLDNVVLRNIVEKTLTPGIVFKDKITRLQNVTSKAPEVFVLMINNTDNNFTGENHDLNKTLTMSNSTNVMKLVTKAFPVNSNSVYNYTFNLETRNIDFLFGVVSFRNSSDVTVNSNMYGNNASNGSVLSLSPGSEVITNLNIVKPSNYAIAVKTKNCDSCTFLKITLERENDDINDVHNITTSLYPN